MGRKRHASEYLADSDSVSSASTSKMPSGSKRGLLGWNSWEGWCCLGRFHLSRFLARLWAAGFSTDPFANDRYGSSIRRGNLPSFSVRFFSFSFDHSCNRSNIVHPTRKILRKKGKENNRSFAVVEGERSRERDTKGKNIGRKRI